MKIMQINAVYGVGSTGIIVEDLHNLSMDCGMESYVAFSKSPYASQTIRNGYVVGRTIGKKMHALLCRINGRQAYFSRCSTKKLIRHIKTIQPDIVHLHNLHSNYLHLNLLLNYLSKTDISVVLTLHDCWFYTGGCFHYTEDQCARWQAACGQCPKKRKDTKAYFLDRSKKILSERKKYFEQIKDLTVVGVSRWISDEARKSVLGSKEIMTIYNGIDTDFFVPTPSDLREKLGLENKFVVLGMANKWLLSINAETLMTVVNALDEESVLLLVGCDSKTVAQYSNKIVTMDYINDRDLLRKVYSMADVFANCTREESLSLVNVEAQACGTPTVTYQDTGVKETVDQISGFAVETGNASAMIEKIYQIKECGKEKYSRDCRDFVVQKFNRNRNYQEFIQLYQTLAEAKLSKEKGGTKII